MRNFTITLTLIFLAGVLVVTGSMIQLQQTFKTYVVESGGTDPVDLDYIHFWSITPEAIQAEDPDGWAVFVQQTRTDGEIRAGVRNDMRAWSLIQCHAIFLRRFGYRYEGSNIE